MKREISISFMAILAGCFTDLVLTNVLMIMFGVYLEIMLGMTEARPEVIEYVLSGAIHKSPLLFAIQTTIGLGCSIFGGYVTARVAGEDEVENAIAASLISVLLGVYGLIFGSRDLFWMGAFFTAITPLFYRLGAQVRVRQKINRK